MLCGDNTTTEACHIKMLDVLADKRECGKGEKPDDRWTLPLCGRHHRLQHDIGERHFWATHFIDPIRASLALQVAYLREDRDLAERIIVVHVRGVTAFCDGRE
jgi:hypothetical protein